MGIRENAGKMLHLIYTIKSAKINVTPEKIIEITKGILTGDELDDAVRYLRDENLVKITFTFGNVEGLQHFIFNSLTPEAINVVEDRVEFLNRFKVELGSLNWNVN